MIIFEKQRRIVRSGSSYGQVEVKVAFGTLSATEIVLRDPIDLVVARQWHFIQLFEGRKLFLRIKNLDKCK